MKKVIIESPYTGAVESNVLYARECMRHSLSLGEAPLASHLLYTQVLDDSYPDERQQGIRAGLAWVDTDVTVAFYIDNGMSEGMVKAYEYHLEQCVTIEFRWLVQ